MNNPFDFFDEIYCINLDHRVDRWQESIKEFKKIGILDKVKRFSAIRNDDGRIGVIKSNLEIVKIAKEKNLNNVLVFEDDVKFINNSIENLKKSILQLSKFDWELFYFGANTHEKLKIVDDNLILLRNAYAVHSMCYNKNIFDKFIKYATMTNKIISNSQILDVWLSSAIQTNNKSYMVNPIITTQRESFSDIEKRVVNYKFIEERFKKNSI